ncbi:MAG: molybdopterin-dependent oxidoreductase [Pararhodobacter sp.]|nr:molybdopterin-dependent oxidoreductase [Pararhodobacter sp.]
MRRTTLDRRSFLRRSVLGASGLALGGCKVFDNATVQGSAMRAVFESASSLTYRTQRLLGGGHSLAREYTRADILQSQHPNGSVLPDSESYQAMARNGFANFELAVTGLVDSPLTLSRESLLAMPARTQITRHDCVEGWSCIAEWTGVPLGQVLEQARPKPNARYVVFHCHDAIERSLAGPVYYYESIDMIDACHPQTILAYGLNGSPLPIANGAPLRVRVERQLGYKMAKYVHTIELVESFSDLGRGKGSYWADRGYEWYAGI